MAVGVVLLLLSGPAQYSTLAALLAMNACATGLDSCPPREREQGARSWGAKQRVEGGSFDTVQRLYYIFETEL